MVDLHPIKWDDEKVARLWDHYSKLPRVRALYFARVFGGAVLRRARLPRWRSLSILDFGCGPGDLFEHVKRASDRWRYSGLDFSEASIAELRSRNADDAQFAGAVHAAQLPSGLASGAFDVILLLEVVEHLTDERLAATLDEVRRLLKPGGLLIVTTPNDEDLADETMLCPECGALFHQWQHVRSWTPDSLDRMLGAHGFSQAKRWAGHWNDHRVAGWVYNRLAELYLGQRRDPHLMMVYRRDA